MPDATIPKPQYYTSPALTLSADPQVLNFTQALLEFHGVDHRTWSYRAAIFLNNPKATEKTAPNLKSHYVGYFQVFAHGGCFGDMGHCEVQAAVRPYDSRRPHPLLPIVKTVDISAGLKKLLPKGGDFTVRVVAQVTNGTEMCDPHDEFLKFNRIRLITRSE